MVSFLTDRMWQYSPGCCVISTQESHHLSLLPAAVEGTSLLLPGNSFLSQSGLTSLLCKDAALVVGSAHNCWVTNGTAWLKTSSRFTLTGSKTCFYSLIGSALMFSICAVTGHFQGCLSDISADLLEEILD